MYVKEALNQLFSEFDLSVDENLIQELAERAVIREVPKKTVIYHEGDAVMEFALLLSGYVMGYEYTEKGNLAFEALIEPGGFLVPCVNVKEGSAKSLLEMSALTGCVLACFPVDEKLFSIVAQKTLWKFAYYSMVQEYQKQLRRISLFSGMSADERYAYYCRKSPELVQKIDQQDMAAIIGVTPVHLSRIRGKCKVEK